MKIYSYFLCIGKRKASQGLDVKTDDSVFCFAWMKILNLGFVSSDN